MWPFSNTEQWYDKTPDMSVKVDIITGRGASDVTQGTRIDNGNNVSITLATAKPENLDLRNESGVAVRDEIKAYIAANPTASDHSTQFQNMITNATTAEVQRLRSAGSFAKKDGSIIEYKNDQGMADKYSAMAKAAGTPDFLPQNNTTAEVQSVTSATVKGQNFSQKKDFVTETVNPYENFYNLAPTDRRTYQQTIGGSDMSVFYLAEYPDMEDVINGVPVEAQRKEIVIFELDSALSLSYSILRERFPVRTIGKANPITYTRGSRTIAGHIAFAVFAEDVLSRLRSRIRNKFNEIENKFMNFSQKDNLSKEGDAATKAQQDAENFVKMRRFYEAAFQYDKVQLLDSLPLFHLLIMGVNEQGTWSKFIIKNVCIVDENQYQGTQQPNIVNKVSWVASDIVPMASFKVKGYSVQDSLNSIEENYTNGKLGINSKFNTLSGSTILESVQEDLAKDIIDNPNQRGW